MWTHYHIQCFRGAERNMVWLFEIYARDYETALKSVYSNGLVPIK